MAALPRVRFCNWLIRCLRDLDDLVLLVQHEAAGLELASGKSQTVAAAEWVELLQAAAELLQDALEPRHECRQWSSCVELLGCCGTACQRDSEARIQFPRSLSLLRSLHADAFLCPCCSLQATAVSSTACQTCSQAVSSMACKILCFQVSDSHLQLWPARSVAGVCIGGRGGCPALAALLCFISCSRESVVLKAVVCSVSTLTPSSCHLC